MQLSLGEVLSLAAAVETCSEHPLAGAVLQFAAAHLAVPVASLDADLTAGLNQLEEPSEASQLLPSPTKAQRHSSPTVTATDWLQPATDIEVEEGEVDIACGLSYKICLNPAGGLDFACLLMPWGVLHILDQVNSQISLWRVSAAA